MRTWKVVVLSVAATLAIGVIVGSAFVLGRDSGGVTQTQAKSRPAPSSVRAKALALDACNEASKPIAGSAGSPEGDAEIAARFKLAEARAMRAARLDYRWIKLQRAIFQWDDDTGGQAGAALRPSFDETQRRLASDHALDTLSAECQKAGKVNSQSAG